LAHFDSLLKIAQGLTLGLIVTASEVPLGTAEAVLFRGAPVVPNGTQSLD